MVASSLQKRSGLPFTFALVLGLFAGCASELMDDKEIVGSPDDLKQNIKKATDSQLSDLINKEKAKVADAVAAEKEKAEKTTEKRPEKGAKKKVEEKAPEDALGWTPTHWPFGVGEKTTFRLRWGLIEGGEATLQVKEAEVLEGEPVLHYRADVKSSRVLNLIYKVEDSMDTWVGAADHLPRRHEIRQNESARWGRRIVVFDQKDRVSRYYSHVTKKSGEVVETRRDSPLENYPQDTFGAIFFYRFADTIKGLNFPIHDRWKHWNNMITFEASEEITVPAGTFKTNRYRMQPRVEGQLEPRGDVLAWFLDDETKLLVKFNAKIKIGSVTGELMKYTPGKPMKLPLPRLLTPRQIHREKSKK